MEVVLEWVGKAFGPSAAAAFAIWHFGFRNKEPKHDVAKELITRLDASSDRINHQGERLARIEGKLEND